MWYMGTWVTFLNKSLNMGHFSEKKNPKLGSFSFTPEKLEGGGRNDDTLDMILMTPILRGYSRIISKNWYLFLPN